MSNKIPPLLSHTPPPIDFDDNDDFRGFESSDIYDYEISLPETPEKQQKIITADESCPLPIVSILPITPIQDFVETSTTIPASPDIVSEKIPTINNDGLEINNEIKLPKTNDKKTEDDNLCNNDEIIESFVINNIDKEIDKVYVEDVIEDDENVFNYRGESPPSLILSQDNFSDNDFNDNDDEELDNEVAVNFNKFNYNENDSNSIPSLKLDSNNDSKCATPMSLNDNSLTASATAITPTPLVTEDTTTVVKQDDSDIVRPDFKAIIAEETINDKTTIVENAIPYNDDIDNDFDDDDDFDNISTFNTLSTFTEDDKTINLFNNNNNIEEEINWNDNSDSEKNDNDDMFVADFSQFNNNDDNINNVIDNQEIVINNDDELINKPKNIIINNLDNENLDDFDDFVVSNDIVQSFDSKNIIASTTASNIINNNDNDNDNDDFEDDFDDFQKNEIIIEPTLNTFKTIIEKVFLLNDGNNADNKNDENNNNDSSNKIDNNYTDNNNLLITIKDFDGAKALNYQWLNSSSNQTLITSLGIDSRNILYGTRWNNSMPRFAANLGFSPLEPLKPSIAVSTSSNSILPTSSSIKSTKQQPITSIPTMSHPLSPTLTTSILSSDSSNPTILSSSNLITNTDVPAAQFDWNSSGLVNPLDDVQEFLNKAGTTETKQSRKEIINENSNNNITEASKIIGITTGPTKITASTSAATAATTTTVDFSTPTSLSIQQEFNSQLINENTVLPIPFVGGIITPVAADVTSITGITSSTIIPATGISTIQNSCNKTTLRETHIFTPNKGTSPISRELNDNNNLNDDPAVIVYNRDPSINDVVNKKQTSTIMIDKKVIIKEYRDIEYNPDKIINNSNNTININDKINNDNVVDDDDDEFTEFKNYPTISAQKQQTILQPTIITNNELNINWPEPGFNYNNSNNNYNINDCNLEEGLENYKLQKENKIKNLNNKNDDNRDSGVVVGINKITKNEQLYNDYQESENIVHKDDDFSDFQFVPTVVSVAVSAIPIPAPVTTTVETLPKSNSMFSLKQQQQSAAVIAPDKMLMPMQQHQPLPQPIIFNCPILEPTTMNSEKSTPIDYKTNNILTLNSGESVFEPKINWGNTNNINPDELARIEAIFPKPANKHLSSTTDNKKPNNKEDDEWSDFVSGNELSVKGSSHNSPNKKAIVKNNQSNAHKVNANCVDDDWNDFVSIQPNVHNNNHQPHQQQQWNSQFLNQGPKFTSWNAPAGSSSSSLATSQEINHSWNFNKQQPLSPLNFNTINSSKNQINQLPMLKQFNQMSTGGGGGPPSMGSTIHQQSATTVTIAATTQSTKPSISLIPDLGFVAPKMFNLNLNMNKNITSNQQQQPKYQHFNYHINNSNNNSSKK